MHLDGLGKRACLAETNGCANAVRADKNPVGARPSWFGGGDERGEGEHALAYEL